MTNPWGFAGGLWDPTQLVKFGTRYYDPNLGRWTQQDPIAGSVSRPGSLNRYTYADCNPTNATDPTGKFCWQTAAAPLLLVAGIGLMLGATFVAPEAVAFALVVGETTFAITGATMSAVGALGLFTGLGVEAWGFLTCGG